MKIAVVLIAFIAVPLASCGEQGRATPAGYWEGTARASDIPMKDPVRQLTRSADAEFWFTVNWDAGHGSGTISGEAEAKYDAELKVDNLPKVTVPAPGGGTVKFEPSVGGKLTDTDNRRKFPIVGAITIDANGNGSLILQKVNAAPGTQAQQANREAGGTPTFDAPMEFTLRADPGVSGAMGGPMGGVDVSTGRGITANAMGAEASTGGGAGVIVQKIPMTPYSPFAAKPGKVEKRPGGPYVASFEEKGPKHTFKWSAKQMGGEKREAPRITPEMQRQIDDLSRSLQR